MYFFVRFQECLPSFALFFPSVTKVVRISIVGRTDRPHLSVSLAASSSPPAMTNRLSLAKGESQERAASCKPVTLAIQLARLRHFSRWWCQSIVQCGSSVAGGVSESTASSSSPPPFLLPGARQQTGKSRAGGERIPRRNLMRADHVCTPR